MSPAPSGLVLSVATAVAAGLMGCYAVMRRMTLAADALSHVALPGIGVALLLGVHPLAGALVALLFGAAFVWVLEQRTRIPTETVIGVVFSTALALGALLTTSEHLMDALFGTSGGLTRWELGAGLVGSVAVIAFALGARDQLIVSLVSPDIALTSGINVRRLDLFYLIAFAVTVALGLRYLGVLLMGSLLIIPAATARRLGRGLTSMFAVSVGVALISTLVGTYVAGALGQETGPCIIVTAASCFLISAAWRGQA
ncbi:MAG TPA: metal ABC transporter permease [Gemmatimonadales bacterium]|nr:metal ABC transporter permease [Gemmatimonadales bacterium]